MVGGLASPVCSRSASPPAVRSSSSDSSEFLRRRSSPGEIAGAGSTAQQAAQEAWIAEFENANCGATISYDPVGSGGGREQFIAGGVAYAGSDAPLSKKKASWTRPTKRCKPGELVEVPDYISPIAIIYNLPDVEELQLDPETLAKIFDQEITTWNDPAIAKDNPGVELPDTRDHPGQPLRRVGHDGELHRLPLRGRARASGRTKSAATGRSRAAKPPTAPPVWSKRSAPAKARSATPTPARPANSASPRSRSAAHTSNRPRRPRRRSSRSRPKTRNSSKAQVHLRLRTRPQDRTAGHLPDRPGLLADRLHQVRLRQRSRRSSRRTSNT